MKTFKLPWILFLIIIQILSVLQLYSQNWPKIFGNDIDALGYDIKECYDKGYCICGATLNNSSSFKFGMIIKTDINGNLLWDKKFGDGLGEDYFTDFDQTFDHGYIISGGTAKIDVENDPVFVKLNPCGEIDWCKVLTSPGLNYGISVVSLPDGQFIGMMRYYGGQNQPVRISLVKMDASGEPIWIKNLANEDSTISNEEGNFLYFTPDNNVLVTGRCFNPSLKPFFIKTDTSGEQLWDIKWPVGSGGEPRQSVFDSIGNIYNATQLRVSETHKLPYLLKFNEDGQALGQYPLMGDTIYAGGAESLIFLNDTTLLVGLTWSIDPDAGIGFSDILKCDTLGNVQMTRHLITNLFPPTSIIKTFDNNIVTIGYYFVGNNWDIYMWKMDTDLQDAPIYTEPLTYDSLCPYQIQSDTLDLDCSIFVNIDEIPTKEEYESTIKISPNPARDWIALTLPDNVSSGVVELAIYNIFGQEVMKTNVIPQNRTVSLNISNLPSGFYLAVAKDLKNRIFKGKFIVRR